MYCAPLGVVRAPAAERAARRGAGALERLTHWDGRCRTACLAVTLAVAALVRGESRDAPCSAAVAAVIDREGGEELEFLVGEAGTRSPDRRARQGFGCSRPGSRSSVAGEAAAAFEEGSGDVVGVRRRHRHERGGAGALLGAPTASRAIPPAWLERLAERAGSARRRKRPGGHGRNRLTRCNASIPGPH